MAGLSGSSPFATIGTKPFSRRRHYDMEDRKQRILGDPKYVISVFCLAISQVFFIINIKSHWDFGNRHVFLGGGRGGAGDYDKFMSHLINNCTINL
jgi:hypothetical protein